MGFTFGLKMIIGQGNIAKILNEREGALFFASGVSNSSCTDSFQFERERKLLSTFYNINICCFYFSSIAVAFNELPYFRHKLQMEQLIKDNFKNYNIIRIGNIEWDQNPNTFLNFLRNKIAMGEEVEIKDEYRYMISKEQLLLITDNLPLIGRQTINIFGKIDKVKNLL